MKTEDLRQGMSFQRIGDFLFFQLIVFSAGCWTADSLTTTKKINIAVLPLETPGLDSASQYGRHELGL